MRHISVEGFNADELRLLEEYKAQLLADAHELRRRVGHTRALGDLITGDLIARGTRIVRSIGSRNHSPLFPPLFLTFVQNLDWIAPTDAALFRMKQALRRVPKTYRNFVTRAAAEPIGGLFELNVYDVLDRAFPVAEPQPKLSGSNKRADVRIVIDGTPIFIEATAINDDLFWRRVAQMMQEQGLQVYATAGPGPDIDARRVVAKVGEELRQTAPDTANVIFMSFFGTHPIELARGWAFPDLFAGAPKYGSWNQRQVDLSHLHRLDSIFEFGRTRLLRVHSNPGCAPEFHLPDEVRARLDRTVRDSKLMIR